MKNLENNFFIYSNPLKSPKSQQKLNIDSLLPIIQKLDLGKIFSFQPQSQIIAPRFDKEKLLQMEKALKKHEKTVNLIKKS